MKHNKKDYKHRVRALAFCLVFALVWNAIPVTANVTDNLQSAVAHLLGQTNETTTSTDYANASTNAKLNYLNGQIATLNGQVTNLKTQVTTLQSKVDELSKNTASATFHSASSWADVQAIVKAGKAKTQFTVGEQRLIDFSAAGYGDALVTLVNISADGKKITCMITAYSGTTPKHNMNSSGTNIGSWKDSEMRTWLNGSDFYGKLPSDLQAVIAETTVTTGTCNGTANGGGTDAGGSNQTTTDKLFLPAEKEIFGTRSPGTTNEANELTQFQYFANIANRRISLYDWWLRSPRSAANQQFCIAKYGGSNSVDHVYASFDIASYSYGVFPAFCIY